MRSAVGPGEGPVVGGVLRGLLEVGVRVGRIHRSLRPVTNTPRHLLLLLLLRPVDLHGQVVEPGPGDGPDMAGDDWDQPPVIVLREDPRTPTCQEREHSRTKVPGRVDGTARVVAQTEAQSEDGDANKERNGLLGDSEVPVVSDGADTDEEEGGGGELVEETAQVGEMRDRELKRTVMTVLTLTTLPW